MKKILKHKKTLNNKFSNENQYSKLLLNEISKKYIFSLNPLLFWSWLPNIYESNNNKYQLSETVVPNTPWSILHFPVFQVNLHCHFIAVVVRYYKLSLWHLQFIFYSKWHSHSNNRETVIGNQLFTCFQEKQA